jgi:glycosyltransferase involved in cell wall biosynthesis
MDTVTVPRQQELTTSKTSTPLRILMAIGGLNRGGTETWALNMVRLIDREKYHIDFLVESTLPYHYNQELRSLGSEVIPCLNYRNLPVYWSNLKTIYRDHGPYDVVHSQVHYFSGIVLAMAARLGVPHRIVHQHPAVDVRPPKFGRGAYRYAMMRLLSRYATAVFACSETSLRSFVNESRPRTPHRIVIPNGVSLSSYRRSVDRDLVRRKLQLPCDRLLITYIARFVPHKNHAQLLRIADRFSSLGEQVHFVFAGSHGSELEHLEKEAALRKNVTLVVGLEDISELLLASDIFAFPSLEEGFGVVAVEAAAAGLPVVATDLPTIREAVSPANRELMFGPNDDAAAFLSLSRLVHDRDLQSRLSAESREWAESFSLERSAETLTAAYDRWCHDSPKRTSL